MWGRLFSIPVACISLASKLRALASRPSRVRASSLSAYLQSLFDWQALISLLVSWNSQLMAIFHNLVANRSTVSPSCCTACQNFRSPHFSLARNTHRVFPGLFCSHLLYREVFRKFPGSLCQLSRGVALSFVYRRLCSLLPRTF